MGAVMSQHFLTLNDLSRDELRKVIDLAHELKREWRAGHGRDTLRYKTLGMIFEKSSTRTRVSFEAGMTQLGGHAMFLSNRDTQLGRGEPIEDSARVISSMVDIIMIRTFDHTTVESFAAASSVPVINALTDDYHPCQLLADIQAFEESRGSLSGKTVTWVGDGNNMCHSYMNAAALLDFTLHIACPEGYDPLPELCERHADSIKIFRDPSQAVAGSHLVVTDVWASMGQEAEQAKRVQDFVGYQVDHAMLASADKDVAFMHCLPAHRGEEVSDAIMEDERVSIVFEEAENRLHAQKALILHLLGFA